jgi:hypothetical protein
MAKVLFDAAKKDPSFAGPFAYYTNRPMKNFLGEEPVPPVEQVIAALAAAELGSANTHHGKIIKQHIQPGGDMTKTQQCISECGGGGLKTCNPLDTMCLQNQTVEMAKATVCKNKCMGVV